MEIPDSFLWPGRERLPRFIHSIAEGNSARDTYYLQSRGGEHAMLARRAAKGEDFRRRPGRSWFLAVKIGCRDLLRGVLHFWICQTLWPEPGQSVLASGWIGRWAQKLPGAKSP